MSLEADELEDAVLAILEVVSEDIASGRVSTATLYALIDATSFVANILQPDRIEEEQ